MPCCIVMQTCTALVSGLNQNVVTVKRYALLYSDADLYGTCVRSEAESYYCKEVCPAV